MIALFRDDHWLVLDKPPGVTTTPPSSRPGPTLLDRAREIAPAAVHHPLSRLDAEVSGAVLFALSRKAIALASQRPPEKRYLALAPNAPAEDRFAWSWPIGAHPRRPSLRACGPQARDAQPAETRGEVLARREQVAALLLTPVTGRTHQLRVHAASAGLPLLGDTAYGGASRVTRPDGAIVGIPRVMLHAWRVTIPSDGRWVEAPPHEDLAVAWRALADDTLARALTACDR